MTDIVHDEVELLLGAYALDAVDPEETVMIERHLDQCPRCRAEVDAYRAIAGLLGSTVEPVPESVWDAITEGLHTDRPPARGARSILDAAKAEREAPVVGINEARAARAAGRRRRAPVFAAALAVAVVAVVAVLGVGLADQNHRVQQLNSALAAKGDAAAVQAALATPRHRLVTVSSPSGAALAEFVVLTSGQGYLVSAHMSTLPADETYQLWAVISGQPISVGLLGNRPSSAAFTIAQTSNASALEVTVEPAGGVPVPDRSPLGSGSIKV